MLLARECLLRAASFADNGGYNQVGDVPEDMAEQERSLATDGVHAGQEPDPTTSARATPIYQTTSYLFESADDAARRYALEDDADIYSRISNPTVRTLEARLAAMHGGAAAVATASGMAAIDALTFVLAETGNNIVTSAAIYGGTSTYFRHAADRRGVEGRFVEALDYEGYERAIDERTAYVHLETIGNPALITPDIARIAGVAHDHDVPLLVDNTFATPSLCRPIEHGADAVWASTTKWIHGGGTTVGGMLVDGGTFKWDANRFPEIAGQNPAYHDTNFAEDFPDSPLAAAARFRSLRSLGAAQSPFDAWVTIQGLETLSLRMRRHCQNATIVAKYLDDHPEVSWVSYPGLAHHETHDLATEYLEGGYGGMISFGLQGGFEAGKRVCEATELISFLANIGDAKSLIIHPASTTHGQLTPEEQQAGGVTRDLVRLSVGIEEPADILADLEQAIERATRAG